MSNRNNSDTSQILDEPALPSPCDLNLVIYFVVSCLLFSIGFKITFFSAIEDEDWNSPTRYWLVGPLFLLSGTIVATFALIYIRSKNLLQLMTRDTDLFEETSQAAQVTNNHASYQNLPPSYTYATSSAESYMATDYITTLNETHFVVANLNQSSNRQHSNLIRNISNSNAQSIERNNAPFNSTLISKDPPPAYSDIVK